MTCDVFGPTVPLVFIDGACCIISRRRSLLLVASARFGVLENGRIL